MPGGGPVRVTVSITTGSDDNGDTCEAIVEDDSSYVPEVVSDLLRRCGESVVWMYQQTHPADVR